MPVEFILGFIAMVTSAIAGFIGFSWRDAIDRRSTQFSQPEFNHTNPWGDTARQQLIAYVLLARSCKVVVTS
ncbi:hypothetical protein P4S64_14665 [Vibrio sp. M60_M31a]